LYVEECHDSCASCNGPTEYDCLTCPSNGTLFTDTRLTGSYKAVCRCNTGY